MPRKRKKTSTRKKAGGRRGRRPALQSASVEQIRRELRRREGEATKLLRKRSTLLRKLRVLDVQLSELGAEAQPAPARRGRPPGRPAGRPPGRPPKNGRRGRRKKRGGGSGRRPRNEMTLRDTLHKALNGRTLGVSEAADAVRQAGYRTNSANFRTQVNIALLKNPDLFRKVSRGQYTAK